MSAEVHGVPLTELEGLSIDEEVLGLIPANVAQDHAFIPIAGTAKVGMLTAGPSIYICNECVELSEDIVEEELGAGGSESE